MDKALLKDILSRLSRQAFKAFVITLFRNSEPYEPFDPLPDIGEGVYQKELIDSYGGSIHAVYLMHFLPIEVFNHPGKMNIVEPAIVEKLKRIRDEYKNEVGQWGMVDPMLVVDNKLNSIWFLNNFAHISKSEYERVLFPQYRKLLKRLELEVRTFGIGSCDSFIEKNTEGVTKSLKKLLSDKGEGLRISLEEERQCIERFTCEKSLFAGVSQYSKQPYEPIFIDILGKKEEVLAEFEWLIKKGAKESELEKFISAHYNDIFGPKYDRIETQLWLRFPQHDIVGKERRLDVFLRNSVTNDWELFEIKRPVKLTSTYRDVPVIAHEVTHAILQVKNYARILSKDMVKKQFAKEGIEYYEPSLNLVIGRTPQIPLAQWRWLLNTCGKDLRIFTFDELIKEMEMRLRDLCKIIEAKE